jgi:hypothetical protein
MKNKIIIFCFVVTIILNYFYGSLLYAKISGQSQLYTIGQLCENSKTDCENTYFKDYLNRINTLSTDNRTVFSNIIIQNDQIGYTGNCPCPNNSDRAGNSCGGRSSYSKGGQISYCYDRDVSDSQVATQRASMIANVQNQLTGAEQNAVGVYNEKYTLVITIIFYCALWFYFRKNDAHHNAI